MNEISNILISLVIAYACFTSIMVGISYIAPNGTQLIEETELMQTFQNLVGSGTTLYSSVEEQISNINQGSGSPADLIYIAFGTVITLIILVGQTILTILYLPILIVGLPFEILINALETAPEDLTPITTLAINFFEISKTVLQIGVGLFLIFELVEFIGGRKP